MTINGMGQVCCSKNILVLTSRESGIGSTERKQGMMGWLGKLWSSFCIVILSLRDLAGERG